MNWSAGGLVVLGIEVQFVVDGRRLTLNDLANLLAKRASPRLTFAKEPSEQPQQTRGWRTKSCERT